MNYLLWLFAAFGLLFDTQDPLDSYRWKNRVIIISTDTKHQVFNDQTQSFDQAKNELKDRDLIIIKLIEDNGYTGSDSLKKSAVSAIRKKYSMKDGEFSLVLIGKDGTTKLRSKQFVSPQKLFDLIDSMPMRQSEMKKKDQ